MGLLCPCLGAHLVLNVYLLIYLFDFDVHLLLEGPNQEFNNIFIDFFKVNNWKVCGFHTLIFMHFENGVIWLISAAATAMSLQLCPTQVTP